MTSNSYNHIVNEEQINQTKEKAENTVKWIIKGMDCPSCAKSIEKQINKLKGVQFTQVSFPLEQITVHFNSQCEPSVIKKELKKKGYEIFEVGQLFENKETNNLIYEFIRKNVLFIFLMIGMLASYSISSINQSLSQFLFIIFTSIGLTPLLKKSYFLIKAKVFFSIETLMIIAAIGAFFINHSHEALMVIILYLFGEKLESFASSKARQGIQSLVSLIPPKVTKMLEENRVVINVSDLKFGDIIEVHAGDRLPADGVLLVDYVLMDESAMTGEPLPVEKNKGDTLIAGSIVVDHTITFKVNSEKGNNSVDKIIDLIDKAEQEKAPVERMIQKFSRFYTPSIIFIAFLMMILLPILFSVPWSEAIYRCLALLLISCPCALIISTPAAITSALFNASKRGVLIKSGLAIEKFAKINSIAFDKTGTLTLGKYSLLDTKIFNNYTKNKVLSIAKSLEEGYKHPIAYAFNNLKHINDGESIAVTSKKALVGLGVEGFINNDQYQLLSPNKMQQKLPAEIKELINSLESACKTIIIMMKNIQEPIAIFILEDSLKAEAKKVINDLKKMELDLLMLTGDNQVSAENVAKKLSINYESNLYPDQKVKFIKQKSKKENVMFIGDGINDAPAMKYAFASIAMGQGSDVALEVAEASIVHSRLNEIPFVIKLAKATRFNIIQNISFALLLKGIFFTTSLMGISGLWLAVIADTGATVLVTLNALRLLSKKY